MGTRHLIFMTIDGILRVAQYGQYDGSPEDAGRDIVRSFEKILKKQKSLEKFKTNLRLCRFLTNAELKNVYAKYLTSSSTAMTLESYQRFNEEHVVLSRLTSAKIIEFILQKPRLLEDVSDFACNSLFCEWCYHINLDNLALRVYKGYNKIRDTNEFLEDTDPLAFLKKIKKGGEKLEKGEYGTVRFIIEMRLNEDARILHAILTQLKKTTTEIELEETF